MSKEYNFASMLMGFDFNSAVDLGLVEGIESDAKFGHCPDTPAAVTDVWELGASIALYEFPVDAGESLLLYSDNPIDEGILIDVTLINVDGFEVVERHPCGTVASKTAIATKSRAVNRVSNVADTETAGLIKVDGDGLVTTNTFAALDADDQQSSQAIYMAPINRVIRINNFSNAVNKTGGATLDSIDRLLIKLSNGVFRTQIRYGLQREGVSNISSDLIVGIPLPPLTKVKISAQPSSGPTDVSSEWSMHKYNIDFLGTDAVNKIKQFWGLPIV